MVFLQTCVVLNKDKDNNKHLKQKAWRQKFLVLNNFEQSSILLNWQVLDS